MFTAAFLALVRSVGIPVAVIWILSFSFLGSVNAVLVVTIALTLINAFSIIIQLLSAIPNLVLLKGKKLMILTVKILIELSSVLAFWIYYLGLSQ